MADLDKSEIWTKKVANVEYSLYVNWHQVIDGKMPQLQLEIKDLASGEIKYICFMPSCHYTKKP